MPQPFEVRRVNRTIDIDLFPEIGFTFDTEVELIFAADIGGLYFPELEFASKWIDQVDPAVFYSQDNIGQLKFTYFNFL